VKQIVFAAAAVAAITLVTAAPASAQANRTFVSGHGLDTNQCTLAAPCRTFAQAITLTNPGGEITVLDPAGYGSVTISKPISIVNDGVGEAGLTAVNSAGIMINAGPTDVVTLRGLTLVGSGTADYGIRFSSGGGLNIQNSVIRGFQGGIFFYPGNASVLNVSDTVLSNNVNDGVLVQPSTTNAVVNAFFERVQALGNGASGFDVIGYYASTSTINATAADCGSSGNQIGYTATTNNSGSPVKFAVISSKAVGNSRGVEAAGQGATMSLALSTISGNATGFYQAAPGVIDSFGNNFILDTTNTGNLGSVAIR
jgi:hypothetical protein